MANQPNPRKYQVVVDPGIVLREGVDPRGTTDSFIRAATNCNVSVTSCTPSFERDKKGRKVKITVSFQPFPGDTRSERKVKGEITRAVKRAAKQAFPKDMRA